MQIHSGKQAAARHRACAGRRGRAPSTSSPEESVTELHHFQQGKQGCHEMQARFTLSCLVMAFVASFGSSCFDSSAIWLSILGKMSFCNRCTKTCREGQDDLLANTAAFVLLQFAH